jgi:TonB family protein
LSPELFPRKELAPEYDGPRTAAIGSLGFHLVLILVLAFAPSFESPHQEPERVLVKRITHLVDPPTQLTQKEPNLKPVSKELSIKAIAPRPAVKPPSPAPAARRTFSPPPPSPVAQSVPPPQPTIQAAPEPPKIELPKEAPKLPTISSQAPILAPPQEKPKLAFQTPAAPPTPTGPVNPKFAPPSIDQAVQNLAHGEGSGGMSVGDSISDLSGSGPGLPASPGGPQSQLNMKSDPMGVDFKPYLIRVLATVKRNWLAVYPEAARLGSRGKATVEFSIGTDGKIQKIVITSQTGSRPLDEAAVAALSMSNPLPALPPDFKGQRIILQFTFAYNIPRR